MDLKATYNKIAQDWVNERRGDSWWVEGTKKFISLLPPGGSILDLGCGGGLVSKEFQEKGFKVWGVDFSETMITLAKKEVPGGQFHVMDIYDIGKLTAKFDGIYARASLLHIPKKDVPLILKKVAAKLKDGGVLYIAVKPRKPGKPEEEIVKETNYGYEYARFFSYFTSEEIKKYLTDLDLMICYDDLFEDPVRHKRWIQIIGKKETV